MQITSTDNSVPKVGELLYLESSHETDMAQSASLIFIDEEIVEGSQWMYTQTAIIGDFGNGQEVYTRFESGGISPQHIRAATNEDILKFIDLMKQNKITEDSHDLNEWLVEIESDQVLLAEEKERIRTLANTNSHELS